MVRLNAGAKAVYLLAFILTMMAVWFTMPQSTSAAPLNTNMLANPGFETTSGGYPTVWKPSNASSWSSSTEVTFTTTGGRSGTKGVVLQPSTSSSVWVYQDVSVIERATYDLTTYYTGTTTGNGLEIKVEYYNALTGGITTPEDYVNDFFLGQYQVSTASGVWANFTRTMVVPEGAHFARIYVRLYGGGNVTVDDISFKQTAEPPQIDYLQGDQIFYYTDLHQGTITFKLYPNDGVLTGKTVALQVVADGSSTPMLNVPSLTAQASMSYSFNPVSMVPKQKYWIKVSLKNSSGTVLESQQTDIYRWERPTSLTSTGTLLVDGKPFYPNFFYHVKEPVADDDYTVLYNNGFNTVQGIGGGSPTRIGELLDGAEAAGLKMLVPLYNAGYIGSPTDPNYIADVVTANRGHAALLAWMIIDEPADKYSIEQMKQAYITIRTLDPVHPIYIVEASLEHAQRNGRLTDILATDPYPLIGSTSSNPIPAMNKVGEFVRNAVDAVGGNKPVWTILQAFQYQGYLPTISQERYMTYQALLAGSQGFGFYAFHDSTWDLQASALWPGIQGFRPEFALINKLSLSPKLSEGLTNNIRWAQWKDGVDVYAAFANESTSSASATITLPYTGYQSTLLYGATSTTTTGSTNQLTATVGAGNVLLYKISNNKVLNGDVELDANADGNADNWSMGAGTWTTLQKHSGTHSIEMNPQATVTSINQTPRVTVTSGKSYTATAWVKSSATTGTTSLKIREIDASGGTVSYTTQAVNYNTDWTPYVFHITPAPTATTIGFYMTMDTAANGSVWFDDFYIGEDYNNLVANPGAEADVDANGIADNWNSNATLETGSRHSGKNSIKLIQNPSGTSYSVKSNYVTSVNPATDYHLAFSASNASTTGAVTVSIRLVDADGNSITYINKSIPNNTGWMDYDLPFTTTDNTVKVQIYLQNAVDGSSHYVNNSAYFDDFAMESTS